mmetsp:Transcript_55653/g.120206  ORF Transcript_55653/g.120206 Transcript_55653/m.120206 type:complete len:492 (+) Transcript_55653:93-1568(+)
MGARGSTESGKDRAGQIVKQGDPLADLLALPTGVLPSAYQRRVQALAEEAAKIDLEDISETLRHCIDFCYGGGFDWAPYVRTTVFADNPVETQMNVPVYGTLLRAWGIPGFETTTVTCKAVPGTDVQYGRIEASPFWSRSIRANGKRVYYRQLIQPLLRWFLDLAVDDPRKQLLINIILQLHEACFNCIGRHKEVFEYCVYDLIESEAAAESVEADGTADSSVKSTEAPAESVEVEASEGSSQKSMEAARRGVCRYASQFLDRHKRNALQAAVLAPLKFLFQRQYQVFENLDSHGASFWTAVFCEVFFPGLEMPFESIVALDTGWSWGAVDFLQYMAQGDSQEALRRLSDPDNLGLDWRQLTRGLDAPRSTWRAPFPGQKTFASFPSSLEEAKKPRSLLRQSLRPYAKRFEALMTRQVLLKRFALAAVTSVAWDTVLGPALSTLSQEALGVRLSPPELRERLCGDCTSAAAIEVDSEAVSALLRVAGVSWA